MIRTYQRGSTLIVVLALLVMITIVGTVAIKNSLVSLNIATNSQAQQIMTQSSDAALFSIEDKSQLNRYLARNGLFGYIKGDANKEKELVFCFRGSATKFFDLNKSSIIHWQSGKPGPTNNIIGIEGYCDMSDITNYTSGRKAVMTQIAVRYTSTATAPFQFTSRGTDTETAKIEKAERVVIHATSLMPTLANDVTATQINDCLSKHLNLAAIPLEASYDSNKSDEKQAYEQGQISVSQCLTNLNVPYTTQIAEYSLTQDL